MADFSDFYVGVGLHRPYALDDVPKFNCGYEEQNYVLYRNPDIELFFFSNTDIELRGPSPIRLSPAFKYSNYVFGSDYNLGDKSGSRWLLCLFIVIFIYNTLYSHQLL